MTLLLHGCVSQSYNVQSYNQKDIQMCFYIYKTWVLAHTKLLCCNSKLITFWKNARNLYDTLLEFLEATVSSIMPIVHTLICTVDI